MTPVGEDIYVGMKKPISSHNRAYWLMGIAFSCLLICFMGIGIPLLTLQSLDRRDDEARLKAEFEVADHWAAIFRTVVVDALSTSHELEGFVHGSMETIPPFNGTKEERIKGQMFERFDDVCRYLTTFFPHNSVFLLAPGGVILQTYPKAPSLYFFDLLDPNITINGIVPRDNLLYGTIVAVGTHPLYRTIGGMWKLSVRVPIFNISSPNVSIHNFWGFSSVVVDIDDILEKNKVDDIYKKRGMNYVVHMRGQDEDSIVPIRYSLKGKDLERDAIRAFIKKGVTRTVLRYRTSLCVSVQSVHTERRLNSSLVIAIVMSVVLGSLFLFGMWAALVLAYYREYDSRKYAPKTTPFALTVIGPCGGMEMWDLAPDRMAKVMEKLSALQYQKMVQYRAYEGIHAHPFTVTLITRSVDSAIDLCNSVLESLYENPIDEPLRELLGDEGQLSVACSVHWCTDATVRMEASTGTLRYEGPDVMYGSRMWIFAIPNQVTVSERVRALVQGRPNIEIQALGAVFLRGVPERQNLFSIMNTASKCHTEMKQKCRRLGLLSFSNPLNEEIHNYRASTSPHSSLVRTTTSSSSSQCGAAAAFGSDSESKCVAIAVENTRQKKKGPTEIHVPPTILEVMPHDKNVQSTVINDAASGERRVSSDILTSPKSPEGRSDGSHASSRHNRHRVSRTNSRGLLSGIKRVIGKVPITLNGDDDSSKSPLPNVGRNSTANANCRSGLHENSSSNIDFITESLLRPRIPVLTDTHLREVFEQQLTTLDLSYDSVRIILYYFYASFKLLLKPLAGPERTNIFRRFVVAFGIPQHNTLEHLAVRCAIRYLQHVEQSQAIVWNRTQHLCLSKQTTPPPSGEDSNRGFPTEPSTIN